MTPHEAAQIWEAACWGESLWTPLFDAAQRPDIEFLRLLNRLLESELPDARWIAAHTVNRHAATTLERWLWPQPPPERRPSHQPRRGRLGRMRRKKRGVTSRRSSRTFRRATACDRKHPVVVQLRRTFKRLLLELPVKGNEQLLIALVADSDWLHDLPPDRYIALGQDPDATGELRSFAIEEWDRFLGKKDRPTIEAALLEVLENERHHYALHTAVFIADGVQFESTLPRLKHLLSDTREGICHLECIHEAAERAIIGMTLSSTARDVAWAALEARIETRLAARTDSSFL